MKFDLGDEEVREEKEQITDLDWWMDTTDHSVPALEPQYTQPATSFDLIPFDKFDDPNILNGGLDESSKKSKSEPFGYPSFNNLNGSNCLPSDLEEMINVAGEVDDYSGMTANDSPRDLMRMLLDIPSNAYKMPLQNVSANNSPFNSSSRTGSGRHTEKSYSLMATLEDCDKSSKRVIPDLYSNSNHDMAQLLSMRQDPINMLDAARQPVRPIPIRPRLAAQFNNL